MKKEQAFELVECFKKQAHSSSHYYDIYHGEVEPMVHHIIYESDDPDAIFIAAIFFENFNFLDNDEYIVEITIGQKFYQLFDFNAGLELIKTIKY
jgi:hypothetical protein